MHSDPHLLDSKNQTEPRPAKAPRASYSHRRWKLSAFILLSCALFLFADVVTPNVFSIDAFPAIVALNVVTAQLTVICIWGTLVRGTFWIRLPWTLLLLVISWCALAFGITKKEGTYEAEIVLGAGLVWFTGFIASFIPLKIAAVFFRWQIIQPDNADVSQKKSYAIRDIMIGTALLAMMMAAGSALLPRHSVTWPGIWRSSGLDRTDWLIAICVFGVVSLFVKLPCIWIALAAKSEDVGRYAAIWAGYCFALTIVELVVIAILATAPVNDLIAGGIAGHLLMGGIVLAVCLALRGLGYRLERAVARSDVQKPVVLQ